MTNDLQQLVSNFCSMLPNLNSLHQPNDKKRLMAIVVQAYLSSVSLSDLLMPFKEGINANHRFTATEEQIDKYVGTVLAEASIMLEHVGYIDKLEYFKKI